MLLFLEVLKPECKPFLLHDNGPASLGAHYLDAKDDQIDTKFHFSSPPQWLEAQIKNLTNAFVLKMKHIDLQLNEKSLNIWCNVFY